MKYYKFVGKNKTYLTDDPTGNKLPPEGRPYQKRGEIEIKPEDGPRIGADSKEIINSINEHGFFPLEEK